MASKSQHLSITSAGGTFQGYFAAPDRPSAPGIVVIQEIFGVNSHIRSVADRLAAAGYAALAPDLFWRIEPGIELGYTQEDVAKGRQLKERLDVDDALEDIRATFEVLAARPECQGKQPGIVGFCFGGLLTYLAATRLNPSCASSYYGGGIVNYLDEADRIRLPMQFHFGSEDAAIPLDHVEQVRQAVAGNPNAEVFVYDGAGHGFHCDQRASYHEPSAGLAWERTLSLFERCLT